MRVILNHNNRVYSIQWLMCWVFLFVSFYFGLDMSFCPVICRASYRNRIWWPKRNGVIWVFNRALAGYIICCMHPNHMYCYSVGHYHQRLPRHHPHQRRLCNSCHSCRSFCGFGPNADFGQTPNDIDVIEAIPFFVCCNTMTIHNTDTHTFFFFY